MNATSIRVCAIVIIVGTVAAIAIATVSMIESPCADFSGYTELRESESYTINAYDVSIAEVTWANGALTVNDGSGKASFPLPEGDHEITIDIFVDGIPMQAEIVLKVRGGSLCYHINQPHPPTIDGQKTGSLRTTQNRRASPDALYVSFFVPRSGTSSLYPATTPISLFGLSCLSPCFPSSSPIEEGWEDIRSLTS